MTTPNPVGFKGRGPVRLAPYAHPDNMQRMGNDSELEFAFESDDEEMLDYEGEGGGVVETDSSVSSVTMGLNLLQRSAQNMALGIRGTVRDAPSSQQTDEAHYAFVGGLTLLNYSPDKALTVTVSENGAAWAATTAYVAHTATLAASFVTKTGRIYECTTAGTSGASEPTWPTTKGDTVVDGTVTWTDRGDVSSLVKDTDFGVSRGGITVPLTGSAIVDGMPIKVTYTPDADQKLIDALKDAGSEYRIVFDGMNRVRDNRSCVIVVWRAKPRPASMAFISDDFGEMPLSFDVLKDESIADTGTTSQYYQIRWQDAA